MLVSDLKTALKKYGFNDNDPLLTWLQEAFSTIQIERKRWSWLELATEINLTANTKTVAIADLKRPVKIRDITEEGRTTGGGEPLAYIPFTEYEEKMENRFEEGNPEYFTRMGGTLFFYPVPATTRKLSVTYIRKPAALGADGTTPDCPEEFHYCIVMGAAYIALMSENEEERANTAQGQFEAKLEKLVEDDMEYQIGEPEFVEEVEY